MLNLKSQFTDWSENYRWFSNYRSYCEMNLLSTISWIVEWPVLKVLDPSQNSIKSNDDFAAGGHFFMDSNI